ncbi:MAG: hypothetical protein IBJ03_16370 [Gemmatimonadaceae bacterium]|nr:hypothetical protein [Gemmatimonadaceae bacterium]
MTRLPLLCALALATIVAACVRVPSRQESGPDRDRLYSGLIGQWRGTLEVRDYRDSARRVSLPTELRVLPVPDRDGLELQFRYHDGMGKRVTDESQWHFNKTLTLAEWRGEDDLKTQAYSIVSHTGGGNAPLRLVLETDGTADSRPARIRETVEVTPGEVRVTKETRKIGESFAFQQKYVLRRAD